MFRSVRPVLHLDLTIPSLLGDSEEQATKRRTDATQAIDRLFRYAELVFGAEDARRIWINVAKPKRGAPKGSRDRERDRRLLTFYDEGARGCRSKQALGRWPRRVGVLLALMEPGRYGASPEAIAKHVRRLVRERDEQRRATEARARMLFGRTPAASLLSSVISDPALLGISDPSSSEGQESPAI
jgi:hypothetical protein